MSLCILHGYLLEGSGSNLWTRSVVEALCRRGRTVHLMAQENHPGRYPFIAEARLYLPDGSVEVFHEAESPHEGCCILHKPKLDDPLPVYVRDRYEEFAQAIPMVELPDETIEAYLERNVHALRRVVAENGVTAMHANHAVLMSVVAERVGREAGVPFAVMPHGSALEYAVKKDPRFHALGASALEAAGRVFVIGEEMRRRVLDVFPEVPALAEKMTGLHLGVDTDRFEPVRHPERPARIARLAGALEGMARGRTPEQTARLRAEVSGEMDEEALRALFAEVSDFDHKAPDAGAEAKLSAIDWAEDEVLLFVGRLISAKGPQEVLAALPRLLEARPRLRWVVVGHGPLREPLEAMVRAMETGDRLLWDKLVAWGRALERSDEAGGDHGLAKVAAWEEALRARGGWDAWWEAACRHVRADRVVFTGYLTHRELRWLFPCCDAAVFPSVVREAGPLVFLEALASGVYPLGTDFGGMRASIDSVADVLGEEAARWMRLDPEPVRTVADLIDHVPRAMEARPALAEALRRVAVERYDWRSVARTLARTLEGMASPRPAGAAEG